jgi:hypothetical protein
MMENLPIGTHGYIVATRTSHIPFSRVSLYSSARGEYSVSCGRIKTEAYNVSSKRPIRKKIFVKRN